MTMTMTGAEQAARNKGAVRTPVLTSKAAIMDAWKAADEEHRRWLAWVRETVIWYRHNQIASYCSEGQDQFFTKHHMPAEIDRDTGYAMDAKYEIVEPYLETPDAEIYTIQGMRKQLTRLEAGHQADRNSIRVAVIKARRGGHATSEAERRFFKDIGMEMPENAFSVQLTADLRWITTTDMTGAEASAKLRAAVRTAIRQVAAEGNVTSEHVPAEDIGNVQDRDVFWSNRVSVNAERY